MSILIVIPHWGLTTGIKVQSAKHYTMEPHPAGKNLMLVGVFFYITIK